MGIAAPGDGVRFGHDLLESVRAWQKARVWRKSHRVMLDKLRGADQLDFSRVIADNSSVRAVHGGKWTKPNRTP